MIKIHLNPTVQNLQAPRNPQIKKKVCGVCVNLCPFEVRPEYYQVKGPFEVECELPHPSHDGEKALPTCVQEIEKTVTFHVKFEQNEI